MTPEHTDMTGAARLREALEIAHGALNYAVEDHHLDGAECLCDAAVVTLRAARDAASEALAAVPEAPEPVWEWRVVRYRTFDSGALPTRAMAESWRLGEGHIECRTAAGPWERVEEGTER